MTNGIIRIAVIGGGFSALTTCFWLNHFYPFAQIYLFKSPNKIGGWMQSLVTECHEIFDLGPNSFRFVPDISKCLLYIIDSINLKSRLIAHKARKRYLFLGNGLHEVSSLASLVRRFNGRIKDPLIWHFAKDLIAFGPKYDKNMQLNDDMSVKEVITKYFGEEMNDYFVDSVCRGIFATDSSNLSQNCFQLNERIRQNGSISRSILFNKRDKKIPINISSQTYDEFSKDGIKSFCLKDGMQYFCESLLDFLARKPSIKILNEYCGPFELIGPEKKIIKISNFNQNFQQIISTISAIDLLKLIPEDSKKCFKLKNYLQKVRYTSLEVTNVSFDNVKSPIQIKDAFGYLVPKIVDKFFMGTIFHSELLPSSNHQKQKFTIMTDLLDGIIKDHSKYILDNLVHHLNIQNYENYAYLSRIVLKDAIPLYYPSYEKIISHINYEVSNNFANLLINSPFVNSISLNDCCLASLEVSRKLSYHVMSSIKT